MIASETSAKYMRKKILWAEIKVKQQEYIRLQKQINELKKAQADITFDVQKKMQESQEIAEWLDGKFYEALKSEILPMP